MLTLLAAAALLGAPAGPVDPAAGLSLRRLVGQRVVYALPGSVPQPSLRASVRRGEVAGVVLFARNFASRRGLRRLVRDLQGIPRPRALDVPLLVMVDQEGGLVKRIPGAPQRSAAELGAIGSSRRAGRAGRATARNLRALGINVGLAPVLDVARAGGFIEQQRRAFGRRARRVARLGGAFARGLEAGGVAATLKHFPGLGSVPVNADLSVQRAPVSLRTLRRVDLAPFGAAIRRGVALVMTGNAIYRGFGRAPALLTRGLVTGELRGRLGFAGVTVTDALDTPALTGYGDAGALALRAARAGNDLLLYGTPGNPERAFGALLRAARSNRLGRPGLVASARRVLALRRQAGTGALIASPRRR